MRSNLCLFIVRNTKSRYYRFFSTQIAGDQNLKSPCKLPEKYFITTPIYYVNSSPHIGHLYSNVLADVVARWHRHVLCVPTKFSTGTDEHGLKVLNAALKCNNEPVQTYCDRLSEQFKSLFHLGDIDYTDFIRTTDKTHQQTVHDVWTKLQQNGYIKEGSYEGWYSVPDETFVSEDQVQDVVDNNGLKKKVFIDSGHVVEWVKEKNYVYKLSEFSDPLLKWLDSKVIYPEKYSHHLKQWIQEGLPDLSISRQREKNTWGIPVPTDETQTIYVWLDALVNYLTASNYTSGDCWWPADCHVIGKDIIKFHAIYWPAFLMGLGLEPPRKIVCHPHWQVNKEKMSKSKGNSVDPFDRIQRYSTDGIRYYLMKDGSLISDSNYSDTRAMECINADLVNTLGNLLSRATGKTINPHQIFPLFDKEIYNSFLSPQDKKHLDNLYEIAHKVDHHIRDFAINKALEVIMTQLYAANEIFQRYKPWTLPEKEAQVIVCLSLETVRVACIALQPVVPTLASKALDRLGIQRQERTWKFLANPIYNKQKSSKLGEDVGPLLQRLK